MLITQICRNYQKLHDLPIVEFIKDIAFRKLIANSHPAFPYEGQDFTSYAAKIPSVLYAGFDPTSDSLHIGNLLILTSLIRASIFGCNSIAVIGEATAAVGDPSGHKQDRKQLSRDELHENGKSLNLQIQNIVSNARKMTNLQLQFKILNNIDWYKETKMIDFMISNKRFRMGEMLRLGPVKSRLENGISLSFTEFSYQILQASDWYMLSKEYGCYCQLGGSDQLGNLKAGYDHIRELSNGFPLGICVPLLIDGSGDKLGKSSQTSDTGFWLNPKKSSPFTFYQYLRQLHDDDAEQFLYQFSLRPFKEIEEIVYHHRKNLGKWIAQTHLADEITLLVHGNESLELAKRCSHLLFNCSNSELEKNDLDTIKELFGSASTFKISRDSIKTIGEIAEKTRNGGAKLMKKGAFKLNGEKITDPCKEFLIEQISIHGKFSIVCWGKRNFSLILWV